jgi:hypothetical protein
MSTTLELDLLEKQLQIPYYVPCRMKDELINKTVGENECGIVNLENSDQNGSHWIMFFKCGDSKIAYSSFGDPVTQELVDYLGDNIYSSDIQIQDFKEKSCGFYCIAILFLLSKGLSFEDIILGLAKGSSGYNANIQTK